MSTQTRFDIPADRLPAIAYAAGMTTVTGKYVEAVQEIKRVIAKAASDIFGTDDFSQLDPNDIDPKQMRKLMFEVLGIVSAFGQFVQERHEHNHRVQFHLTDKALPEIADIDDYGMKKRFNEESGEFEIYAYIKE